MQGKLKPGDQLEKCMIRVEYDKNGILKACDPYRCDEVLVGGEIKFIVAPAIASPFRISSAIYVEFERSVFANKGDVLWATSPLELVIYKKNKPILNLPLTESKYTLVGSLVEGVIARYHRSQVNKNKEIDITHDDCVAKIAFYITQGSDKIKGVPFNAAHSVIYVDKENIPYYSLVEVSVKDSILESKTTGKPPKEGLKILRKPETGRTGLFSLSAPVLSVERGWKLWPSLKD